MTQLIDITIGVRGERTVQRKLGLAADVVGDLREVFDESVLPFMQTHMKRQFATSGDWGGKPWAGYEGEPKYRAYKRRIVGHLDVLRWEKGGKYEILYPSLTDEKHPFAMWRTTPKSAEFGTRVPHARRLVKGGTGPFGERYPGRDIIALRPQQRKYLITAIQRSIVQRFGPETIRRARFI